MTRQLIVDTSTQALSISLLEADTIVATTTLVSAKQHGAVLVPAVHQLLTQMEWTPEQIEAIGVGVGPGAYTGLRIGVTLAKTWAEGLGTPLYQFSSLALMAAQLPSQTSALIIPVMDARRLSAYTGIYQYQSGELKSIQPDCHSDWHTWLDEVVAPYMTDNAQVVLIGERIEAFVTAFQERFPSMSVQVIQGFDAWPHTQHILRVPMVRVEDPLVLVPEYAHLTVAEQEWQVKQGSLSKEQTNADFVQYYS